MPAPSDATAVDVCVVGSANLDLVATTARLPLPGETVSGTSFASFAGGKGLNQAVAAARAGATVSIVAALGDDDAGQSLAATLAAASVDVRHLRWIADQPSGRALITVDDTADNTIVVVPGANAHLAVGEIPPARLVLAQLEVPLDAVRDAFEHARAIGATTVLNPAPARPLAATLLGLVDIIVPNEHEAALLGGTDALRAAGVRTVITTLGAAGVRVEDADGAWTLAAHPTTPLDPTAAGDSFCGHLVAALAGGAELDVAVQRANAAGALATMVAGAVPSIPSGDAVDGLLSAAGAPQPSRLS